MSEDTLYSLQEFYKPLCEEGDIPNCSRSFNFLSYIREDLTRRAIDGELIYYSCIDKDFLRDLFDYPYIREYRLTNFLQSCSQDLKHFYTALASPAIPFDSDEPGVHRFPFVVEDAEPIFYYHPSESGIGWCADAIRAIGEENFNSLVGIAELDKAEELIAEQLSIKPIFSKRSGIYKKVHNPSSTALPGQVLATMISLLAASTQGNEFAIKKLEEVSYLIKSYMVWNSTRCSSHPPVSQCTKLNESLGAFLFLILDSTLSLVQLELPSGFCSGINNVRELLKTHVIPNSPYGSSFNLRNLDGTSHYYDTFLLGRIVRLLLTPNQLIPEIYIGNNIESLAFSDPGKLTGGLSFDSAVVDFTCGSQSPTVFTYLMGKKDISGRFVAESEYLTWDGLEYVSYR